MIQLTEDALRTAAGQVNNVDIQKLFDFSTNNGTAAAEKRAVKKGECKAFPDDSIYPKDFVWSIFDLLLRGSLIKITPVGTHCYEES